MRLPIALALLLTFAASAAHAGDVEDVNATADRFSAALNEHSVEAAMLFVADDVLVHYEPVPLANVGKPAFKQFMTGIFGFTEQWAVIETGPRTTRVTGDSAVLVQNIAYVWKPIDGGQESMFLNSMQTWAKVDGEWLLTGMMTNALPHGTTP